MHGFAWIFFTWSRHSRIHDVSPIFFTWSILMNSCLPSLWPLLYIQTTVVPTQPCWFLPRTWKSRYHLPVQLTLGISPAPGALTGRLLAPMRRLPPPQWGNCSRHVPPAQHAVPQWPRGRLHRFFFLIDLVKANYQIPIAEVIATPFPSASGNSFSWLLA